MKYKNIVEGKFLSRPNRFIANVDISGENHVVHVKNTGRCKELLVPGNTVYLEKSDNPKRKTAYDLIAVVKDGKKLINMDSQIVNPVAEEWIIKGNLFPKEAFIRREVKYGNSRFDFYAEYGRRKAFIEVKGVTLEDNGVTRFPDAPTERGLRHINELVKCMNDGYEAYVLFVIQMKEVLYFTPNYETHAAFGEALRRAREKGVKVIAVNCNVGPDFIEIDSEKDVLI